MKISRITLIIIGVVIFGVAFGLLYMAYSRQLSDQQNLKAKLASNQAQLSKLSTDRQNWQNQLVQVQAQLAQKQQDLANATTLADNVSQGWPGDAQSIDYDETLFNLAAGWNLPITVVSAGDATPLTIQGIAFQTTQFSISVTGQPITAGFDTTLDYETYIYSVVGNILGFVDTLSKDKNFATAKIDLVNLTIPQLLTADQLAAKTTWGPGDQPSATVQVTVYARK